MTQHPVPIDVAAATLSTTTAAIRKRIKRGTLAATKDGAGRWLIFLPESPSTEATRKAGQGCPDEVDAGLDAGSPIPDEGASARIAALEREAAVLRAELSATRAMVEQLQGERDYLRQALAREQQIAAMHTTKALPAPSDANGRGSWLAKVWTGMTRPLFTQGGGGRGGETGGTF